MYHLLKGLHEFLTRKDEFQVVIIGMDGAGKTTLLEKIKTLYNKTPGLPPERIGPTIGQNTGKIALPSSILQFMDLGGQSGIRTIWHRYYDDANCLVYVVDASDRNRLPESWEVLESVLSSPKVLEIPLLLLANKQDSPDALSVENIRYEYEAWWQNRLRADEETGLRHARRDSVSDIPTATEALVRSASLDVLGISALEGTGVREAIDWIFLRVQNANKT